MKQKLLRLFYLLIVLIGLGLMFYPWISNYFYEHAVDSIAQGYEEEAENLDDTEYDELLEEAREYNENLAESKVQLTDPFVEDVTPEGTEYSKLLSYDDTGIMGFVDIPKINVYIPIYHGTSTEVLQQGAGHVEGSSLPIGGESTHSVISAHTGINSKKLFTDLTEMEEGDLFFIHVLNQTLAYRVISVNVILPEDTSKLVIQNGKDLVTLLTCTPYGVNDHRLIVTGERTEYTEEVESEAEEEVVHTETPMIIAWRKAIIIAFSILIFLLILYVIVRRILRKKNEATDAKSGKEKTNEKNSS